MNGQFSLLAICQRNSGHSAYITILVVQALLVFSATPTFARNLPLPPSSCAGLYVGTWTGNWGSTNVFPDGTAKPSSNQWQEWTCNGNTYTFYVPENGGNTYTNKLSTDRNQMTLTSAPGTVATRAGSRPPSGPKPSEKDHCSTPPPGEVRTTTAFDGVTACIFATNNNSLPRCAMSFIWRGSVSKTLPGQVVNPGETAKQCGRPNETLSFVRWNSPSASGR
jgi:hypothetical protein